MNVKELIEILKKFDENLYVNYETEGLSIPLFEDNIVITVCNVS